MTISKSSSISLGKLFATTGLIVAATVTGVKADELRTTDGETCIVVERDGDERDGETDGSTGLSTSVTAGGGSVSSSTTVDGTTTSVRSGNGSATSSAAASTTTSGTDGTHTSSIASSSGPDGTTIVTRGPDGHCIVTESQPDRR